MSSNSLMWLLIVLCSLGILYGLVRICIEWQQIRRLHAELKQVRPKLQKLRASESDAPLRLDQRNWAEFERTIQNLKQIIVVADIVEKPHASLRDAVIHN